MEREKPILPVGQEEALQQQPSRNPAAVAIDVDRLAGQVTQLASSQNLRVVPATPMSSAGSCQLVLLGSEELSAAEFCELAASAGARLLYVQAEIFDSRTDLDLAAWRQAGDHQGPADDLLADLQRDAERFSGHIRQLELAFAAGCVLHCWAVAADWYSSLVDRATALLPSHPHES